MEFSAWLIGIGLLLVVMHATSHVVARLPLSPAILYFLCGIALGPRGLDLLQIDPAKHAAALERLFELALVISLFATGSNLGTTLRGRHWGTPLRLATAAMVITIAGIAALTHYLLHMPLGAAIIVGAALAPTDPVLAGDVQVADAKDRDRLRFGLTGEAGLNDGAAFPFIALGLGLLSLRDLGTFGWRWWLVDFAWGLAGGIAIGAALGIAVGRWVLHRVRRGVHDAGEDAFLGLGIVAVAYGTATLVHAYGFLAVFAAAMALQWSIAGGSADSEPNSGAAAIVPKANERSVAIASLQRFNSDLESLVEFGVVIVVGVLFSMVAIPWEALWLALALFLVVRPLAVFVSVRRVRLEPDQRTLTAWFGIRGVGSMYYAMFALNHGWSGDDAQRMLGIVLGVVAASIFLHGISVTPLMSAYQRNQQRLTRRRGKSR